MSSTEDAPARPPQATLAAWMVILCSVYVVLTSIEGLGTLTSLAARESAQDLLDQNSSLSSLSVEQFLDIRRWTAVGAAVLAGVAAVLAFFAWRRDLAARRVLAVVAVLLFVVGIVNSSFSTMLIAVAVIMLWREPVASWFAGRTPPEPVAPRGLFALGAGPTKDGGAGGPAGAEGRGDGQAADWTAQPPNAETSSAPRPRQTTLAVVITWIFGTLTVLMAVASLAVVVADPDLMYDQALKSMPDAADRGVTRGMLQAVAVVMLAAMIALAAGTITCAMGLLQRRRWGALGLLAQCWFITMFCALGVLIGGVALVIPAAAAIWVIVLVRSRETRVWVLTAPREDGTGPGQFADQYPGQFTGQYPGQQPGPYQGPPPPYAAPQQPPVQEPTAQAPVGHVSDDLNPHLPDAAEGSGSSDSSATQPEQHGSPDQNKQDGTN